MKKAVANEKEETVSSTEAAILLENTPKKMSDPETETSLKVSVKSEEVALQIKAVTDPLNQQLAHLCEKCKNFGITKRTGIMKRPPPQEMLARLRQYRPV